jgi:hypothetical protein
MSRNEKEIDLRVGKITFGHPAQDQFERSRLETLIRGLKLRITPCASFHNLINKKGPLAEGKGVHNLSQSQGGPDESRNVYRHGLL